MQLSPGLFTGKWADRQDILRSRKKLFSSTVEAKRRRRQLKQERLESSAAKEILEGSTYQSNVDLHDGNQDIDEIPDALPNLEKDLPLGPFTRVYYDLETTSLCEFQY